MPPPPPPRRPHPIEVLVVLEEELLVPVDGVRAAVDVQEAEALLDALDGGEAQAEGTFEVGGEAALASVLRGA